MVSKAVSMLLAAGDQSRKNVGCGGQQSFEEVKGLHLQFTAPAHMLFLLNRRENPMVK